MHQFRPDHELPPTRSPEIILNSIVCDARFAIHNVESEFARKIVGVFTPAPAEVKHFRDNLLLGVAGLEGFAENVTQ